MVSAILLILAFSYIASAIVVDLPYGLTLYPTESFLKLDDKSWRKPLLAYFAVPYAQPPVGELRFRSPVEIDNMRGAVLRNDKFGNMCLQASDTNDLQSEDCLTLSVFKPQNIDSKQKLPVLIWIHGGSFNMGSSSGPMVPGLVGNSPDDFIGVAINYRLGALGFLPSSFAKKAGILNLGLADQLMAVEWVQKHIELFGGDPNRVTIAGTSAGAHSVGAHLQHVYDKEEKIPFSQAIMSSGGPTVRVWPNWTYPLYEEQAEKFLKKAGCHGQKSEVATFNCLRSKDANAIKRASTDIYNKYNRPPLRWPFQPVVDQEGTTRYDGDKEWLSIAKTQGFVTDEGSTFIPNNQETGQQFKEHVATLMPFANASVLETIENLYPDPKVKEDSPYKNSPESAQFKRLSAAFTDYAYSMAVKQSALSLANYSTPVWKYHFDFNPIPGPKGVTHGSDSRYLYMPSEKDIGGIMNAYYSAFIVSGDPNSNGNPDRPNWPKYDTKNPRQMTFTTKAEVKPDNIRAEQIEYWMSIAEAVPR